MNPWFCSQLLRVNCWNVPLEIEKEGIYLCAREGLITLERTEAAGLLPLWWDCSDQWGSWSLCAAHQMRWSEKSNRRPWVCFPFTVGANTVHVMYILYEWKEKLVSLLYLNTHGDWMVHELLLCSYHVSSLIFLTIWRARILISILPLVCCCCFQCGPYFQIIKRPETCRASLYFMSLITLQTEHPRRPT